MQKEYTPEQVANLIGQLKQAFSGFSQADLAAAAKDISGTPNAPNLFGPRGLFSVYGLDNVVINASLVPRGIDALLPVTSSNELTPLYGFITGFDADVGASEPDGVCDDAPGAIMEVCRQTAVFGRYTRGSHEMEVNKLMQVLNNHLTTDLQLLGNPLGQHTLLPVQTTNPGGLLSRVIQLELITVGQSLQQLLSRQLWSGNPANNSNGGGYMEFPGLGLLVNTGKVDAISGVRCEALDPDVKDFAYNSVDSTDVDIVRYLTAIARWVSHVADRTGLSPVTWAFAMRPQLFSELVEIWPCRYLTNRCANSAGTNVAVINDMTNVTFMENMRKGQYLTIDGVNWPVVLDDGITEENSATTGELEPGEFASDIYLLPLKVTGGRPVLYWEHLNYDKAYADTSWMQGREFWPTDGGRYLWTMQQKNYCFKFQAKIEPRVILRTPQLAGRLRHVKYSPLQHLRDAHWDSPYRLKGGVEDNDTPVPFYTEW